MFEGDEDCVLGLKNVEGYECYCDKAYDFSAAGEMTPGQVRTDDKCSYVTIDVAKDLKFSDTQWSAHYTWTYPYDDGTKLIETNSLDTLDKMTKDMSHLYTSTIYRPNWPNEGTNQIKEGIIYMKSAAAAIDPTASINPYKVDPVEPDSDDDEGKGGDDDG